MPVYSLIYLQTDSYYIAQPGLGLRILLPTNQKYTIQPSVTLNFDLLCLSLPSAAVKGMCNHPGLCNCEARLALLLPLASFVFDPFPHTSVNICLCVCFSEEGLTLAVHLFLKLLVCNDTLLFCHHSYSSTVCVLVLQNDSVFIVSLLLCSGLCLFYSLVLFYTGFSFHGVQKVRTLKSLSAPFECVYVKSILSKMINAFLCVYVCMYIHIYTYFHICMPIHICNVLLTKLLEKCYVKFLTLVPNIEQLRNDFSAINRDPKHTVSVSWIKLNSQ